MNQAYSYDDVLLVPQYSDIRSRSEIDIGTDLGKGVKLSLPVIASPMDTISGARMAAAMSVAGGTAVIHRYNTPPEQREEIATFVSKTTSGAIVGAAIGVVTIAIVTDLNPGPDLPIATAGDFAG